MTSPGYFFILGCGGGMSQLTHQEQKTENSSLDSPRANQQGDRPVTELLSLYSPEPGESNHAEAGAEEPGSGGLPDRAAGEYC